MPLKLSGMLSPAPGKDPTNSGPCEQEKCSWAHGLPWATLLAAPIQGWVGPFRAQMQHCPFLSPYWP